MSSSLKYIEVKPSSKVKSIVIWLHGLGADAHDFAPIVPQLNLSDSTLFIFPHAPNRPITINQNMVMPGWYDVMEIALYGKEDSNGILSSNISVQNLITKMTEIVPAENIYLVGFSQGGAMSLYSGLTYSKRLGGIAVLSSYVPIRETLIKNLSAANAKTPIFMAHGIHDTVVPFKFCEISYQYLHRENLPIEWHTYPMEHQVCDEQMQDLAKWFKNHM